MKKLRKRLMSWLMVFAMMFSTFAPFVPMTVHAASEYDATIDDVDIGTVVEGFNQTDFYKNVKLTNTGTEPLVGGADYMKIELTSGDTDAFGCDFRDSGYIPSTYRVDKASVYPKNGLTAGTYTATLTLSYDRDGNETAYSWEVLDTATVTVKVNTPTTSHNIIVENGTSDKSTASEGETVHLTAEPVNGNMAFSEWEVISGGITIINKDSFSTARFTMPNNEVRIRAKYVNLNYSATIDDVDIGTVVEGFNQTDFYKNVKLTNTGSGALDGGAGYMKIELTSGDTDAFGCDFRNTGYILSGGFIDKAYVYPKAGLTAGTYTATLTLSYDRDGNETAYGWEELDTATVTFKVNGSGVTQHTVTFDLDGGIMTGTNPVMVNDGDKVTQPADPGKSMHRFIGWYADALRTTPFIFNTEIKADTTIYAKFVEEYNIAMMNGTADKSEAIEGETVTITANAPGTGQVFDKWEVNAGQSVVFANEKSSTTTFVMKAGDVKIAATYKPDSTPVTVTFELNGGTMTGTNPVKVNEGEKVTRPSTDPTRTGYYFEGWYKESTFNNRFEFTTETISGNTSIYAKWLPKVVGMDLKTEGTEMNGANYRLKVKSLDVNFHTSATPVTIDSKVVSDLYVDNTCTTPLTTAPVAGTTYYFTVSLAAGDDYIPKVFWDDAMKTGSVGTATNATIGYSDLFRSPGSGSAMILFTYKELSQPVNIAVDYNGGTNNGFVSSPLEKGSVINKSDVEASLNSPLVTPPTNKEFDYLEIDGVKWTSDTYTVNSDITVKIIWKDKAVTQHTVTFFNDEGGVISSTNVNSGEKVTRPSTDPTKAGYRFDDWYTDGLYNTKFVFDNPITIDTRIYAKFDKEYNVTITDGGPDKTVAIYGELVSITADPAPLGKEFDKWVVEEGTITLANANNSSTTFAMPKSNVKVKATYKDKATTYTILEGANQTYTIDSNVDVIIKASGDKANLTSIKVDGTVLDTANYDVVNGSTILTLKASYLNTLSEGDHSVEFVYNDGSVKTNLKVVKNSSTGGNTGGNTNPSGNNTGGSTNTGNNNTGGTTNNNSNSPQTSDNIMINIITLLLSLIGMAGGVTYINRKKLFNK